MCRNKALQREMLIRSQCSQLTISPEHETGRTESGPEKKQPEELKRMFPSCSQKFNPEMPRLHSKATNDRLETKKQYFHRFQKILGSNLRRHLSKRRFYFIFLTTSILEPRNLTICPKYNKRRMQNHKHRQ